MRDETDAKIRKAGGRQAVKVQRPPARDPGRQGRDHRQAPQGRLRQSHARIREAPPRGAPRQRAPTPPHRRQVRPPLQGALVAQRRRLVERRRSGRLGHRRRQPRAEPGPGRARRIRRTGRLGHGRRRVTETRMPHSAMSEGFTHILVTDPLQDLRRLRLPPQQADADSPPRWPTQESRAWFLRLARSRGSRVSQDRIRGPSSFLLHQASWSALTPSGGGSLSTRPSSPRSRSRASP